MKTEEQPNFSFKAGVDAGLREGAALLLALAEHLKKTPPGSLDEVLNFWTKTGDLRIEPAIYGKRGELPTMTMNALYNAGFKRLKDLNGKRRRDLLEIKWIGDVGVNALFLLNRNQSS